MASSRIEKPIWHAYFDNMSKALGGKRVEIEIDALAIGSQVAAEWLPLLGITYDPKNDIIIQYVAADAFAYSAPVIDSCHRNRMVRGEPVRHARVEQGVIELPPDFSAGYKGIFTLQEQPPR